MPPCDPSLQPRDFSFRTTSKNAVADVGTGPMLPRQRAVSRRYVAHWTPGFFGIKRSATRNPGSPCSQVARSTRFRSSEVRPEAELTDRAGKWINWVQWQVYSWGRKRRIVWELVAEMESGSVFFVGQDRSLNHVVHSWIEDVNDTFFDDSSSSWSRWYSSSFVCKTSGKKRKPC